MIDALHDLIVETVGTWGYAAVFVLMVLESACIPIPSEITMPVGGLLAAEGTLNLWVVGLVGAFANLVGSWIAYAVGATGGRAFVMRYGRYVRVSEHDLDRADAWFARYGDWAVFIARLVPLLRALINYPAGVARMPLGRFLLFSTLGSLPWNAALLLAGYLLGANYDDLYAAVRPFEYVIYAFVILGGAHVIYRWIRGRGPART